MDLKETEVYIVEREVPEGVELPLKASIENKELKVGKVVEMGEKAQESNLAKGDIVIFRVTAYPVVFGKHNLVKVQDIVHNLSDLDKEQKVLEV